MKTMLLAATMSLALAPLAIVQAGGQQPAAPAPATNCPYAAQMAERLQRMQTMREAVARAATPEERSRLREEQWTLMRENMQAMHGMGGMGAMPMHSGMGMGATGAGGPGTACTAQRMAMMEMMLESMADRMGPPAR